MRVKKTALIVLFSISISPFCYADLTIANHTSAFGTAHVGFFCTSILGSDGILKPHSSLTVSSKSLKNYCFFNCSAKIYASKNCSGKPIATVSINPKEGVTSISNHHVNGFMISGHGNYMSIDGGKRRWFDLFSFD